MNHVKIIMIAISVFGLGCFTDPIEPTLKNDAERQDTPDTDATDSKKDLVQTECVPEGDIEMVCKLDDFTCVACMVTADCMLGDHVCNTDLNTCVECLDNTLCTDAATSKCSAGTCGACTMDTECEHIDGLPRCDASPPNVYKTREHDVKTSEVGGPAPTTAAIPVNVLAVKPVRLP